jgi:hypothetical protein
MMMVPVFVVAQQTLNFFQVAREGLWELYLFFLQTIRDGRIAWLLVIVAGVLVYQRFFKK